MSSAIVRRLWPETARLSGVLLEVEPEVAASYRRPGQVVVLRTSAGEKVYLAIASNPGEVRSLELLIGPAARDKLGLAEGQKIELDPPSGPGFAIEKAAGKDVLLFAVGSALAPIRPLVEQLRRNRSDYGRVVLYVGAHTAEDLPYRREMDAWSRDRIDVVRSVGRPWVQDRFRADQPPVHDAVAYVVGMKAMIDGVRQALIAAGMPDDRISSNW